MTPRHVGVTIAAVEEQEALHMSSLCFYSCISYWACTAQVPNYIVTYGHPALPHFSTFTHN